MEEQNQPDEKDQYIAGLQNDLENANSKNAQMNTALGVPMARDGNFLQFQLDSADLIEKLENFYRGRYIGIDDASGEQIWKEPKDDSNKTLNEHGVNLMMETVTKYIDKNTVLSYYSEERIYEIMADIGDELTLVLFCNYEEMGMNNYFKKTKFRLLVLTTLHVIESTYRRAIAGRAAEKLNESRVVTQSDNVGMNPMAQQNKKRGFNLFNPTSWVN